jgi:hypothetical protein
MYRSRMNSNYINLLHYAFEAFGLDFINKLYSIYYFMPIFLVKYIINFLFHIDRLRFV